ncbi:MAG TPA: tetratricopeptide repeat protein [Vicinamibacterales bacterium]|jgi:TolA-binding protein
MKTARIRRASIALRLAVGAFVLVACATVGHAQTGRLKGKVVDANNKPVEGATVVMESKEMNRKFTTKTDRRGEYTHFLAPGPYVVTVTKDSLSQTQETRVSIDEKELNFTLRPGGGGGGAGPSDADRKKMEAEMAAVKTAFEAGVAADRAGNYDEAIAKFNEVAVKLPKCTECYANIGSIHMRKKEYELAEAAYKKAIDANPNSGEAYMGLANAYNAQRKFDLATEAGATANKLMGSGTAGAAGGASAGAVFNQGVIAWNAGKIPDAQKLFEQAVTLDPKLADAHYWLGMANVNQGKLPEAVKSFEEYLKLDAKGQYAEQAKSMLAAIKK